MADLEFIVPPGSDAEDIQKAVQAAFDQTMKEMMEAGLISEPFDLEVLFEDD